MKQKYVIALAILAIAINFYVGLTHEVLNPTQIWIVNAKISRVVNYTVNNNNSYPTLLESTIYK